MSGYYGWLRRPPSARSIRHAWLGDVIWEIHSGSRQTYGAKRVHAELALGRGIAVCRQTVETLMRRAGLQGISGRPKHRKIHDTPTASDLVDRHFARVEPDRLWAADITEHPTREGKACCAVVLDTFSRRVVGWSIDSRATASLVTNALGMAIDSRSPTADETVYTATKAPSPPRGRSPNAPSTRGCCPRWAQSGTATTTRRFESFWSRMQVELLDRKRWHTRLELANAIFEYLEIWHNRQRRHSALGMLTPVDFENRHQHRPAA